MRGRWPRGTTRVAGVLGDPVVHSLSPAIFNGAFEELDLDWVFVGLHCPRGRGRTGVRSMGSIGITAASVTMPHKLEAFQAADRATDRALRLESANSILSVRGDLVADNTDGAGLVDSLRQDHGWDPGGKACAVLGTGGAARAAVLALADAGAASVSVVGRREGAAARCAALAGERGRVGRAETVSESDLVVNATPVGMKRGTTGGDVPFELDHSGFGSSQMILDMVYAPPVTGLMVAGQAAGAVVAGGAGMLVRQAARQFEWWTGQPAPVATMQAVVAHELAQSRSTPG